MSKDTRRCNHCNTMYEKGFFGTGYKYCSPVCRRESSTESMKVWYKKTHPRDTKKKCLLCKRNIKLVGQRKNYRKYCSALCMERAGRIRQRGSKYVYIKIPVDVIPHLFK